MISLFNKVIHKIMISLILINYLDLPADELEYQTIFGGEGSLGVYSTNNKISSSINYKKLMDEMISRNVLYPGICRTNKNPTSSFEHLYDKLDSSFGGAVFIGSTINNITDLMIKLGYLNNNINNKNTKRSLKIGNFSGLISIAHYFPQISAIQGYLTAGFGLAYIDGEGNLDINSESKDQDEQINFSDYNNVAFAYEVGGGLKFNITPIVSGSIGYSYFGTKEIGELDNRNTKFTYKTSLVAMNEEDVLKNTFKVFQLTQGIHKITSGIRISTY